MAKLSSKNDNDKLGDHPSEEEVQDESFYEDADSESGDREDDGHESPTPESRHQTPKPPKIDKGKQKQAYQSPGVRFRNVHFVDDAQSILHRRHDQNDKTKARRVSLEAMAAASSMPSPDDEYARTATLGSHENDDVEGLPEDPMTLNELKGMYMRDIHPKVSEPVLAEVLENIWTDVMIKTSQLSDTFERQKDGTIHFEPITTTGKASQFKSYKGSMDMYTFKRMWDKGPVNMWIEVRSRFLMLEAFVGIVPHLRNLARSAETNLKTVDKWAVYMSQRAAELQVQLDNARKDNDHLRSARPDIATQPRERGRDQSDDAFREAVRDAAINLVQQKEDQWSQKYKRMKDDLLRKVEKRECEAQKSYASMGMAILRQGELEAELADVQAELASLQSKKRPRRKTTISPATHFYDDEDDEEVLDTIEDEGDQDGEDRRREQRGEGHRHNSRARSASGDYSKNMRFVAGGGNPPSSDDDPDSDGDDKRGDKRGKIPKYRDPKFRAQGYNSTPISQTPSTLSGRKSAKVDVPRFFDDPSEDKVTFDVWYHQMENKLRVNADHYDDDKA
ncbi:hypothetical protein N0V85_008507, partial [Neurospora sp. IMI 360204]